MPAKFTHRPLMEVEDAAKGFGLETSQEARFATGDLEAEDTGVSLLHLPAGERQPFAHKHDDAEEVYVVVEGSGRIKLDDEIVELKRLDAVRIAPSVTRQVEAGEEGIAFVAVGPRHKGDGELVHDWWTD